MWNRLGGEVPPIKDHHPLLTHTLVMGNTKPETRKSVYNRARGNYQKKDVSNTRVVVGRVTSTDSQVTIHLTHTLSSYTDTHKHLRTHNCA